MTEGFDVVVVGAGSAGCVVASRLAEKGDRSVLLLEAGPDRAREVSPVLRDGFGLPRGADWTNDWGYRTEPTPGAESAPLRRGKLVGGTSWLTRFAVRGSTADFDAWAASGLRGCSFEELLPWFRRVERDVEFGAAPWHGDAGPVPITRYPDLPRSPVHLATIAALVASGFESVDDMNAPGAYGVGPMPMSSLEGRRVSASDAYLAGGSRPDLVLRPGSEVAGIEVEAGTARGVRLLDGTLIHADEVVVCGGTYGSPTLLLRSGIGPAEELRALGLPIIADLPGVGRNLVDHPAVELEPGWSGTAGAGPVLHSIAAWRSAATAPAASLDLLFWTADPSGEPAAFTIECVLMRPRSRGRVTLRSADSAAPPRITLPSLTEQTDVDRLGEAALRAREVALRPELRAVCREAPTALPSPGPALDAWVRENAYSVPHVVGTCAMGRSAAEGAVVDAEGRVHGIDRLRVVDASIIPDPPSGFPNLITMMLAERIASKFA